MAKRFTEKQIEELDKRFNWYGSASSASAPNKPSVPGMYNPMYKDYMDSETYRDVAVYAKQYINKRDDSSFVLLVPEESDVHNPDTIATLQKIQHDDGTVSYLVHSQIFNEMDGKAGDFGEAIKETKKVLYESEDERTVAVVDVSSTGRWVKEDLKGKLRSIAGVEVTRVKESDHTSQKGGMMAQKVKTGGKTYEFITRDRFSISPEEEDRLYDRYTNSEDVEDIIIYTQVN